MPKPVNPFAAPDDAVGGPSDWRVSLAGLLGLTGVDTGDGPGDGERCGRRVCEAMTRGVYRIRGSYDDQPRDMTCTWGQFAVRRAAVMKFGGGNEAAYRSERRVVEKIVGRRRASFTPPSAGQTARAGGHHRRVGAEGRSIETAKTHAEMGVTSVDRDLLLG
jgi:hypothetical protein